MNNQYSIGTIKKRYTNEEDLSLNDISRHTGVQMTDFDLVFYSKKTFKISLIVEKKHNGLTGGYPNSVINMRENSIELQKKECGDRVPFGVAITYTKESEQDHQMIYFIPQNELCWIKLNQFLCRKIYTKDLWLTPKQWAKFIWFCTYGQDPIPAEIEKEHNSLPDIFCRYYLPKIICNAWSAECKCKICKITELNNNSIS